MYLFLQNCWETMLGREDADFMPQIEQPPQSEIEKVSAAAGRIKDADMRTVPRPN